MGFDPFRKHRRSFADLAMGAVALLIIVAALLWALSA
jgi:hypothetical protein